MKATDLCTLRLHMQIHIWQTFCSKNISQYSTGPGSVSLLPTIQHLASGICSRRQRYPNDLGSSLFLFDRIFTFHFPFGLSLVIISGACLLLRSRSISVDIIYHYPYFLSIVHWSSPVILCRLNCPHVVYVRIDLLKCSECKSVSRVESLIIIICHL